MEIRELYLKNFGKFSNQTFQFSSGINVVYGENEFGKTTMYSFIKGMLFGMERSRGRAAKRDVYHIYEPWENPGFYSGSMRFECEHKQFCLNRHFDKVNKMVSLVCETDGEVLDVAQGDLDILIGGVSLSNYENTISIGQRKVETMDNMAMEIKNYAANYATVGDSDIQIQNVNQYLKNKKKEIEGQIRTKKNEQDSKCEKLALERNYIQREIERLEVLSKENNQKEMMAERKDEIQKEKKRIHPIAIIGFLALSLALYLLIPKPWNILALVVVTLAEGLFIWNKLKHKVVGKEKQELTVEIEKVRWEKTRIDSELKEKTVLLENLVEQIEEIESYSQEEHTLRRKIESIEFAIERVNQVSRDIQKSFGKELNEKASDILKYITDGKYSRLSIDDDLQITLIFEGQNITIDQISRGTVEQVYFALRMAIANILHTEELPIILDDTFVYYDDVRSGKILEWLSQCGRQVILFTCHKREQEIMEQRGIKYNIIKKGA